MEFDPSDLKFHSTNTKKKKNQQTDESLGIKYRIELSKPKALGREFGSTVYIVRFLSYTHSIRSLM